MREQIEQVLTNVKQQSEEFRKERGVASDAVHYRIYDAKLALFGYVAM